MTDPAPVPLPSHHLTDRFNNLHVSMISIGGIIGAGLFIGTSAAISRAGPAVLLSYVVAGVIVWLVLQLLGQLSIHARGRGSFITHIATHNGQRAAFIAGWGYIFIWAVNAGSQAVAGGIILNQLTHIAPLWGALAFVVMGVGVNMLSLHYYGHSEAGLSIIKLVFLTIFIALGVGTLIACGHFFQVSWGNITGHGGFFPKGSWAAIAVIPIIVQTFTGCEISVIAATDSYRPLRSIARTVKWLPLQVLFFYAGSMLIIVSLLPWDQVRAGHSAFLTVLDAIHFPLARGFAVAVTLIAIASSLNSSVYVVSRSLKELGSLKLAPSLLVEKTDKKIALIITTLLELIIIFAAASSPEALYPILLGASGGLILFVYFIAAIAFWQWQTYGPKSNLRHLATALILLIAALGCLMLALPDARTNALFSFTVIILLYMMSIFFLRKKSSLS